MDELIKLVKTYRVSAGLAERLRLADEIIRLIRPDLHLFVFKAIPTATPDDVLQEILKSIALNLKNFTGGSNKEFWAWCYTIARRRLNDHFREKANDRLQPMLPEELGRFVDTSRPLSAADKHDLDYAMKLLTASKPECYDYLWKHFVIGLDFGEIAEEESLSSDTVRMRTKRCLETAQALVS